MIKKHHIGELIKKQAKELHISNTEFAKLLNCDRSTINYLFKQPSIDLYRLIDISKILNHDFIGNYFCEHCASRQNVETVKTIDITNKDLKIIKEENKRIIFELRILE